MASSSKPIRRSSVAGSLIAGSRLPGRWSAAPSSAGTGNSMLDPESVIDAFSRSYTGFPPLLGESQRAPRRERAGDDRGSAPTRDRPARGAPTRTRRAGLNVEKAGDPGHEPWAARLFSYDARGWLFVV